MTKQTAIIVAVAVLLIAGAGTAVYITSNDQSASTSGGVGTKKQETTGSALGEDSRNPSRTKSRARLEESAKPYKITPPPADRPGSGMDQSLNKLTVDQQGNTAIINVTSESGMGNLTIQPQSGKWPEKIHVRLYLKGLEGFSVSSGTTTVDRSEMNIKAFDSKGKPFAGSYLMDETGHYEKGYYEAVIPAELFADKSIALTLNWTDFYRR